MGQNCNSQAMGGHIEAGSCDSEDISLSPSESILRIKGDTCKRVNIILTPKPNTTFNNVILYFSFLKYYSLSYIYIYKRYCLSLKN